MMSKKIQIILLMFLLLGFCIETKRLETQPSLHRKMMKLLQSCFADRLRTVIITPNLEQSLLETSLNSGPIPMIMMDGKFESDGVQRILLHLPTFVFAPRTMKSFETVLHVAKSSSWWHIDALFFIIGGPKGGCNPAAGILRRTWEMNLTNSFFLCHDQNDGAMLYTFNPFTNRAPHPWKEIEVLDRPDDRWTLYAQRYSERRENCDSLNFDKTKYLDGYKVKVVANAKPGVEWTEDKQYNVDSLRHKCAGIAVTILFANLFPAMNVTAEIKYDYPGYFHNGKAFGFLQKLINGSYDISLSSRFFGENLSTTYPFLQGSAKILTQQRNFLTPEEKILSFYSTEIQYLTAIVLFVTFVFILVIYKKRNFALAAFDVLRLLLSTGLVVPFNRTAIRIFIFGIFQLIIILNATFQGNLSAFLTKPERRYVNNMEDLHTYQYNVYAPMFYQDQIQETKTQMDSINYIDGVDCTEYVVNDSSTACIEIPTRMLESAFKHNLHISESNLPARYGVFWCRENWQLKEKVNHYLSRFIEAGLSEYLYDQHLNIPLQKLKSREEKATAARYRPIALKDLAFTFRLLGIGLGISTIVFMIEMFSWQKFLRVVKKLRIRCTKSWIVSKLRRRSNAVRDV